MLFMQDIIADLSERRVNRWAMLLLTSLKARSVRIAVISPRKSSVVDALLHPPDAPALVDAIIRGNDADPQRRSRSISLELDKLGGDPKSAAWIVGSPNDVRYGLAMRCLMIGLPHTRYTPEDLRSAGVDLAFRTPEALVQWLTGRTSDSSVTTLAERAQLGSP